MNTYFTSIYRINQSKQTKPNWLYTVLKEKFTKSIYFWTKNQCFKYSNQ